MEVAGSREPEPGLELGGAEAAFAPGSLWTVAGAVPQEAPRSRARCPRRPEASARPRSGPSGFAGARAALPAPPDLALGQEREEERRGAEGPRLRPKVRAQARGLPGRRGRTEKPAEAAAHLCPGGATAFRAPRPSVRAPDLPAPAPLNVRALPGSPHPEEGGTNTPPGRRSAGVGCVAGPGVQEGASRLAGPQRFVQVLSFGTDVRG